MSEFLSLVAHAQDAGLPVGDVFPLPRPRTERASDVLAQRDQRIARLNELAHFVTVRLLEEGHEPNFEVKKEARTNVRGVKIEDDSSVVKGWSLDDRDHSRLVGDVKKDKLVKFMNTNPISDVILTSDGRLAVFAEKSASRRGNRVARIDKETQGESLIDLNGNTRELLDRLPHIELALGKFAANYGLLSGRPRSGEPTRAFESDATEPMALATTTLFDYETMTALPAVDPSSRPMGPNDHDFSDLLLERGGKDNKPGVMYTPAGSRIEPSVIAIASRTPNRPAPTPELGTDNNGEAAKTVQPSTPETRARRRIIPAESTDTSIASKPAKPSAKPLRTIGTPTPEEKSKEAIIDPWNAALKYVSALRAKYGSSLSMSPESIRKHLVEANVDEAEAEETALEIFRRMQKEKIVDGRPLVKGGGTGRRVLMDRDNILGRLNKMNEE